MWNFVTCFFLPEYGSIAVSPLDSTGNYSVTAHQSTASVPVTILLYDGLLLCGFNVAIKGLMQGFLPVDKIQ